MSTIDPLGGNPVHSSSPSITDASLADAQPRGTEQEGVWERRAQRYLGPPNDTKIVFDSLRNMGICIAMLLGLPALCEATAAYMTSDLQWAVGLSVVVVSAYLASVNVVWTLRSLEVKSRWLANLGLIFLAASVYAAFAYDIITKLPQP